MVYCKVRSWCISKENQVGNDSKKLHSNSCGSLYLADFYSQNVFPDKPNHGRFFQMTVVFFFFDENLKL